MRSVGVVVRVTMIAAALAVVLAGCTDGGGDEDGPAASGSSTVEAEPAGGAPAGAGPDLVVAREFAFTPAELEIAAGAEVRFENADRTVHTVTAPGEGGFDVRLEGEGSSTSITFDETGAFPYTCTIHAGMEARIVVR